MRSADYMRGGYSRQIVRGQTVDTASSSSLRMATMQTVGQIGGAM